MSLSSPRTASFTICGQVSSASPSATASAWWGPSVAAAFLVGKFGHVWSAHEDRHSGSANGVGGAIRLGDHSGHGADADQSNVLFAHELCNLSLVHGLGVTINQQHFMAGRSQCLEQEHPEMRHEIAGYTVVGVIEQNSHDCSF